MHELAYATQKRISRDNMSGVPERQQTSVSRRSERARTPAYHSDADERREDVEEGVDVHVRRRTPRPRARVRTGRRVRGWRPLEEARASRLRTRRRRWTPHPKRAAGTTCRTPRPSSSSLIFANGPRPSTRSPESCGPGPTAQPQHIYSSSCSTTRGGCCDASRRILILWKVQPGSRPS